MADPPSAADGTNARGSATSQRSTSQEDAMRSRRQEWQRFMEARIQEQEVERDVDDERCSEEEQEEREEE